MGQGYLGAPEQTAQVFVPNPFSHPAGTGPGARLYLTGDQGRWNSDGQLEFINRLDRQVKMRGHRIELAEIEAVLQQHPLVRDIAVVIQEPPTGPRIVAFVVPRLAPPTEPNEQLASALRVAAQEHLPGYMVPSVFVPLPALPINTNGKVDRRALEALSIGAAAHPNVGFIESRTPVEESVAHIWATALGLPIVDVQSDFYTLGGDPSLAEQVARMVREMFDVELSIDQLFEVPTVEAAALAIEYAVLEEIEGLIDEE